LVPGVGVYAGEAFLANGEACRAAISIGTNPTVTPGIDAPRTVEAFLIDFDGDLYDQPLTLSFHHFLRGTEKFDSLDALIAQMHRDVALVRFL
ncbi:MAG: riboflavin kinase, partial [Fibrella sp.]|nr:riboflavin kinase [Armatimonadota bacterium]